MLSTDLSIKDIHVVKPVPVCAKIIGSLMTVCWYLHEISFNRNVRVPPISQVWVNFVQPERQHVTLLPKKMVLM